MEKKEYDDYTIEQLLPLYFEGKVSDEEYHLVKEWIDASEDHFHIAKQVNTLILASDTVRIKKELNTEKALANISKRIDKKNRIAWWLYIQRLAAILFLPLLIAYGLLYFKTDDTKHVEMVQSRTNPGMITRIELPDGSIAYLNSETTLVYPSSFGQGPRQVLLSGEAFFEVKPNKDNQFLVSTISGAKVEVTGTKFNVEAYRDKKFVSVTLIEGGINFLYRENAQNKKLIMQPGHTLIYDLESTKTILYKSSGRSETAWVKGGIIFEKTSLEKALHMLEKRYHVEFIITDPRFKNDSFSGEFTSQRLERILEYFKLSSDMQWRYIETDYEKNEKTKIEIY